MELYKKIDKSVFRYGTTIPKKYVPSFLFGKPIPPGQNRKIQLTWKRRTYEAAIVHVNRKNASTVHQIRWDNNEDLIVALKKEFIQTYVAIESQNYEAKQKGRYYVTRLLGGTQEVLVFRPVLEDQVELETFIKIETPYDNLFRRLVEENVFGWLTEQSHDYLITKSTPWYDKTQLSKHEDAVNVVYYLVDETNELIYIGSAKRLGDRVKVGRKEIPGWNKFKYELVHPDYHHLLRRIEFHAIRAFAGFLENKANEPFHRISCYKLVNKVWPRRR